MTDQAPRGTSQRLPFFHWRDEGEPIRPGLNVYPLSSPYHLGGYLALGALRIYVRWAKKHRRLHHSVSWVTKTLRDLPRSQWRFASEDGRRHAYRNGGRS